MAEPYYYCLPGLAYSKQEGHNLVQNTFWHFRGFPAYSSLIAPGVQCCIYSPGADSSPPQRRSFGIQGFNKHLTLLNNILLNREFLLYTDLSGYPGLVYNTHFIIFATKF